VRWLALDIEDERAGEEKERRWGGRGCRY